jgi:hypothetical protein
MASIIWISMMFIVINEGNSKIIREKNQGQH